MDGHTQFWKGLHPQPRSPARTVHNLGNTERATGLGLRSTTKEDYTEWWINM